MAVVMPIWFKMKNDALRDSIMCWGSLCVA
jgi:hypothetical protein